MKLFIIIIIVIAVVQGEIVDNNKSDLLAVQIREIENRPEYLGCKWGIHARNIVTNQVVYENMDANRYSVIASNGKVPNTYSAWMSLGKDYVFSTPIASSTDDSNNDVVNLTICGSNDPSLTTSQLQNAAASISAIPSIKSAKIVNVRLDNSRGFDSLFPNSWEWGDLQYYYGAVPGSFILDGNVVTVRVEPSFSSSSSSSASVVNVTTLNGGSPVCFEIVNEATIVVDDDDDNVITSSFEVRDGSFALVVRGSMSQSSSFEEFTIACRDPLRHSVSVFSDALISNGLSNVATMNVDTSVVVDTNECNDNASYVAMITSDTLDVLLNHTLLESDNTYAEAILRRQSDDGSITSGINNVMNTLEKWSPSGLNISAYSPVDGSGLSRHNLITPTFLASIMASADEDYIHLLPLAGETGTLESRFIGTPAQGILYAKTGTMTHVNALSGRVNDIAFSILSDSCPQASSIVREGIDDIAVLFAEY